MLPGSPSPFEILQQRPIEKGRVLIAILDGSEDFKKCKNKPESPLPRAPRCSFPPAY